MRVDHRPGDEDDVHEGHHAGTGSRRPGRRRRPRAVGVGTAGPAPVGETRAGRQVVRHRRRQQAATARQPKWVGMCGDPSSTAAPPSAPAGPQSASACRRSTRSRRAGRASHISAGGRLQVEEPARQQQCAYGHRGRLGDERAEQRPHDQDGEPPGGRCRTAELRDPAQQLSASTMIGLEAASAMMTITKSGSV